MNRRLLVVLVASALAADPARLRAQLSTHLSLSGGLAAPIGDLGRITDAGYNIAAALEFGAPLIPLGVRVEGGFNGFNYKSTVASSGNVRIASGTINAVLALGPTGASPYLIGGVGLYNRDESNVVIGPNAGSKTVGGVNAGGGIRFPLGLLSTFIEARYHHMLGNAADNTNWHYVPITFGVSF
jgi:hypothetical protein